MRLDNNVSAARKYINIMSEMSEDRAADASQEQDQACESACEAYGVREGEGGGGRGTLHRIYSTRSKQREQSPSGRLLALDC